MKTRPLARSGGTLLGLFVLVNLLNPTEPLHTELQAAPGLRSPARQPEPTAPEAVIRFCENVYKSVCQKKGETQDPTGAVHPDAEGELQALRIYQELIQRHPEMTSEQVDEESVKTIYTPKRAARIESAYRWVWMTMEKYIDRQPYFVFNRAEKKQLKRRIRETRLQLPLPATNYADEPDLFTKSDVFYERMLDGTTRMRVGGAYVLTAKSWFNIVFTFAHEFAHAVDPCELRAAGLSIPAYDRLSACFLKTGIIAARRTRAECGENDQLSEAFADWLAVQIVSDALAGFATEFHGPQLLSAATNSVRDLCEQDEGLSEIDVEYHPSPEIRIEHIFGRNPSVRQVLGCAPAPAPAGGGGYCDFNWIDPTAFIRRNSP